MGSQQMLMMKGGGGTPPFTINKSVRLRRAATAKLARTFGTPTAQNIWTFSGWFKRGAISVAQDIFSIGTNNAIYFNAGDAIVFVESSTAKITTAKLFRDPEAHYHLMFVKNGTALEIFCNGVSVGTGTATNTNTAYNTNATIHNIGGGGFGALDGYSSETIFVDGQAVAPTQFGQFDASGVWVPKAYLGTFGANGFHMNYANASRLIPNAVPAMTSNIAPSGIASASSENAAANAAWKAFDQVETATGWATGPAGAVTGWLAYEFTAPKTITQYVLGLFATAQATRMPKSWTFEGWDGSAWVVLSTVVNDPGGWTAGVQRTYPVASPGSYIKYRINVTANQGDVNYVEIDVFELDDNGFLTADISGNNNWASTGVSVTPGVTYDSMIDTPTNNFATLSPIDFSLHTLSNAALTYTTGSASYGTVFGTQQLPATGKWYWEVNLTTLSVTAGAWWLVGIATEALVKTAFAGASTTPNVVWGDRNDQQGIYKTSAVIRSDVALRAVTGDVAQIAYDADTGNLWFGKNDQWYDATTGTTGNPATGANPTVTMIADDYVPLVQLGSNSNGTNVTNANFGQRPFGYTPPTGFVALSTANQQPPVAPVLTGSYTGNGNANGPMVWTGGVPKTLTINAVNYVGTASIDVLAGGFKVRTATVINVNATVYNWTATYDAGDEFAHPQPAQVNP